MSQAHDFVETFNKQPLNVETYKNLCKYEATDKVTEIEQYDEEETARFPEEGFFGFWRFADKSVAGLAWNVEASTFEAYYCHDGSTV